MARVAIFEPSAEVRELFARLVVRLGHEPVLPEGEIPDGIDLVLVEPVSPEDVERTLAALARYDDLVVVCASTHPHAAAAEQLGPKEYLVKPFDLHTLGAALNRALGA